MRITSSKNLSKNYEKYLLHWEKLSFELIENTAELLCILQNFWPRKGPEYLYQLFDVLPKQETCEMKAPQVYIQVYIQQWFHDEQEANFIVTRNNFRHVLICYWVTLFLTVSCRISFIKMGQPRSVSSK